VHGAVLDSTGSSEVLVGAVLEGGVLEGRRSDLGFDPPEPEGAVPVPEGTVETGAERLVVEGTPEAGSAVVVVVDRVEPTAACPAPGRSVTPSTVAVAATAATTAVRAMRLAARRLEGDPPRCAPRAWAGLAGWAGGVGRCIVR